MQLIGFNFSKIAAHKQENFSKAQVNADIKFPEMEKQKLDLLKEDEAVKIIFNHTLTYKADEDKKSSVKAELNFEGNVLLALSKDEAKDITKAWKNKELPQKVSLYLSNLVLKKCAAKALQLQEELNIPSHIQVPRLGLRQQ